MSPRGFHVAAGAMTAFTALPDRCRRALPPWRHGATSGHIARQYATPHDSCVAVRARTDPGDTHYDPEAGLYEGFATLGIVAQLTAGGVLPHLPLADQLLIAEATQEAVVNIEAGLAAIPGEAKSVHGAFHLFEHRFLDSLPHNHVENGTSGGELPEASSAPISATSQLVQAMAGFGGSGAADTLNTAPLSAGTSQQTLLTTPHA
jgi:hypothetical protein